MTLTKDGSTLRERLNAAAPNTLADKLAKLGMGDVMAQCIPQQLVKKDPAASSYQLATLEAVGLSDFSRAATILRAFARAGGVTGELTVKLPGVTPATGEIAVAPNGDIVVLAADAITSLDVLYMPEALDVYEVELPVASNDIVLPTSFGTVLRLLEVEALTGGVVGKNKIIAAGARSVTTTQVNLKADKTTVQFVAADAVTKARVKFGVAPAADRNTKLLATAEFG